ncbi:MAG: NusA-like transcription termination signal-binding factor [Candidatus Aenigmatarchaeota archaeon]
MQRFDTEAIRLMTLFENITGAPVKDCIIDNNIIYFVVEEGKVGMAIGKNGNSVRNAEKKIGKIIKIFEFSNDLVNFVKNLVPQAVEVKVKNEGDKTIVEIKVEKKDRALVIGRDGKNLSLFKQLLRRTHNVNDLIIR